MKPAISAGASQDGLVMRRPLDLSIKHSTTCLPSKSFVNLENLILVRLEAVKLELEVPEVPEGDCLVCAASGKDELGVGVEAQAVNLDDGYVLMMLDKVLDGKEPQQCARQQCGLVGWLLRSLCPRCAASDHLQLTCI